MDSRSCLQLVHGWQRTELPPFVAVGLFLVALHHCLTETLILLFEATRDRIRIAFSNSNLTGDSIDPSHACYSLRFRDFAFESTIPFQLRELSFQCSQRECGFPVSWLED
ncbi:unnamed protein product [Sphenostylis stenocarpa]|uniref:Uncharacterized protein n=1 Tax=Sphenostylis stenocarpa TaxID=92480 RepID=A0AA86SG11_9FABA|nr:unnamed protein product [Sphenostylis stenocarpa]